MIGSKPTALPLGDTPILLFSDPSDNTARIAMLPPGTSKEKKKYEKKEDIRDITENWNIYRNFNQFEKYHNDIYSYIIKEFDLIFSPLYGL